MSAEIDSNIVSSQFAACVVIVWLIQYLKLAKWFPLLDVSTDELNRVVSAFAAVFAASALHFAFDSEAGRLVIDGMTVHNIAHLGWAAAVQFAGQQVIYDAIYRRPALKPVQHRRKKRR